VNTGHPFFSVFLVQLGKGWDSGQNSSRLLFWKNEPVKMREAWLISWFRWLFRKLRERQRDVSSSTLQASSLHFDSYANYAIVCSWRGPLRISSPCELFLLLMKRLKSFGITSISFQDQGRLSLADVVFKHGLASFRSLSDRAISHVLLNILNRVQDLQ